MQTSQKYLSTLTVALCLTTCFICVNAALPIPKNDVTTEEKNVSDDVPCGIEALINQPACPDSNRVLGMVLIKAVKADAYDAVAMLITKALKRINEAMLIKALLTAIDQEHEAIADFLINNGVCGRIDDIALSTAAQWAAKKGYKQMAAGIKQLIASRFCYF